MNLAPNTHALKWQALRQPESISLLLVIGFHAALLLAVLHLKSNTTAPLIDVLSIQMLRASPPIEAPVKPLATPPKPTPVQKQPPKPVIKRAITREAVAAPKPEPKPVVVETPTPPVDMLPNPMQEEPALAPAVVPPRFDAAYLNNPTPSYPALSRRNGETGRVLLRVQVGTDGLPKAITIAESSQFARLDEAALAAVERWRFIPAKQGDKAITEWVLVPLNFKLTR
ncbi:MAG: TonB family protein [Paraperlucidibaca sp.]